MSLFSKIFGRSKARPGKSTDDQLTSGDKPFMEYPSDAYGSSTEAMTSALELLKTGGYGNRWITFCAQGKGHDQDSYQSEEVKVLGNTLDLQGQKLDIPALLQFGGLEGQVQIQIDPQGMVTLPDATPEQMARFLDALFQKHFGIHPHDDEDDYEVGAEW